LRQTVFANNYFYHAFNRGAGRQPTFKTKKDYKRAIITLDYYQYEKPSLRLAKALILSKDEKERFFENLKKQPKQAEIISYCLMPNHFHLLLKQKIKNGIPRFLSNFSNSYTRYFNTKRNRVGSLFQGIFKAVRIETDEQLIHVSRYIHLNPATSLIIREEELDVYPWSSFPEYLNPKIERICNQREILGFFPYRKAYRKFVYNQIDYAKRLEEIKHLTLEKY
jgi:putative transposase